MVTWHFVFFVLLYLFSASTSLLDTFFPFENREGKPHYLTFSFILSPSLYYHRNGVSTVLPGMFNQRLIELRWIVKGKIQVQLPWLFTENVRLQSISYMLSCFVPQSHYEVSYVVIPVLEARKPRLRVITRVVQGHSLTKGLIWEINPGLWVHSASLASYIGLPDLFLASDLCLIHSIFWTIAKAISLNSPT